VTSRIVIRKWRGISLLETVGKLIAFAEGVSPNVDLDVGKVAQIRPLL